MQYGIVVRAREQGQVSWVLLPAVTESLGDNEQNTTPLALSFHTCKMGVILSYLWGKLWGLIKLYKPLWDPLMTVLWRTAERKVHSIIICALFFFLHQLTIITGKWVSAKAVI